MKGRNVTLDFASTVFGNLGVHVFTRFFEDAETYYRTLFRAVDFANNPEEAKEHINIFVANVTRDSIKDLVRQAPDPNTLLMLVNAVYFNGNWEIPFEEEYTEDRPFHVSAEETLEVMFARLMFASVVIERHKNTRLYFVGSDVVQRSRAALL